MSKPSDQRSPISRWFPGHIPNIFLALCIKRLRERKNLPSEPALTVQWIAERDAPEVKREHALFDAFTRGALISDEDRTLLETLMQRRMQKPPADMSSDDPNNIPSLRAAFLAHTLQSVAPTEEETRVRIKNVIKRVNPPGSTNEDRIKNVIEDAKRKPDTALLDPFEEQTLIEVANRMGWISGGQPNAERVARAVRDQTQFIMRFLAMMYGRQPTIMEQGSRDELLAAMDLAEEEPQSVH